MILSNYPENRNDLSIEELNRPNHLIVHDVYSGSENSTVCLSPDKMHELRLFQGDTVLLKGTHQRKTVAFVHADSTCHKKTIRLSLDVQNYLRVDQMDIISIHSLEIKYGKRIEVMPVIDGVGEVPE